MRKHQYQLQVRWTGNLGEGTNSYTGYSRQHEISTAGKGTVIHGSSDPAFRGDASRYNPEEMLVSALSTCHMLWYLHLCSASGIRVISYIDHPVGTMIEEADGAGQFEGVLLRPEVHIVETDKRTLAMALHQQAHEKCFIARSVNFEVACEATLTTRED